MTDLHGLLAAKMRERPETNLQTIPAVTTKWLISPDSHIHVAYCPRDDLYTVSVLNASKPGVTLPPKKCPERWEAGRSAPPVLVLAGSAGRVTAHPASVTGLAERVAAAVPCPAEYSVYGYFDRGRVTVLAFAGSAGPCDDRQVLRHLSLAGGVSPPRFQEPLSPGVVPHQWWRDVDAGLLRCLDADLAGGTRTLCCEPGGGYFKLILDGQVYQAAPGQRPPLDVHAAQIGAEEFAEMARRYVAMRAAAVKALRS